MLATEMKDRCSFCGAILTDICTTYVTMTHASVARHLPLIPQHVGAALNLAALHHRYGDTGDAIDLYRKAANVVDSSDIEMMVMLR